jgi:hypothetical protein
MQVLTRLEVAVRRFKYAAGVTLSRELVTTRRVECVGMCDEMHDIILPNSVGVAI